MASAAVTGAEALRFSDLRVVYRPVYVSKQPGNEVLMDLCMRESSRDQTRPASPNVEGKKIVATNLCFVLEMPVGAPPTAPEE